MAVSQFVKIPYGIQRNINLLKYKEYHSYIEDYLTTRDLEYITSLTVARQLVILGQGTSARILSADEFKKAVKDVIGYLAPFRRNTTLQSIGVNITCPLMDALAKREEPNIEGKISTIIFLRDYNTNGHEVSAYIDYRNRLCTQDWTKLFNGKKKLMPKKTDLSHYNWKNQLMTNNDTPNFLVRADTNTGLLCFYCVHDRKTFFPQGIKHPCLTRTEVKSKKYLQAVLYDHMLSAVVDMSKY